MAPETIAEFIDLLDRLYPDKCPGLHDTDREIWYACGQRSVVEKCIQMMTIDEEDEDTLTTEDDPI